MTEHTFERIGPHVHWLSPASTTDRPVLGVIHGTLGTLVVEAGNSAAHAELLLREIAQAGIAPPDFVTLTHWHWDHVFGTATLDLPTFSHIETQRVVREMADYDWSDGALDRRVETGVEVAFCRDMIKAELPDRSDLMLRPAREHAPIEWHSRWVAGDTSDDLYNRRDVSAHYARMSA